MLPEAYVFGVSVCEWVQSPISTLDVEPRRYHSATKTGQGQCSMKYGCRWTHKHQVPPVELNVIPSPNQFVNFLENVFWCLNCIAICWVVAADSSSVMAGASQGPSTSCNSNPPLPTLQQNCNTSGSQQAGKATVSTSVIHCSNVLITSTNVVGWRLCFSYSLYVSLCFSEQPGSHSSNGKLVLLTLQANRGIHHPDVQ